MSKITSVLLRPMGNQLAAKVTILSDVIVNRLDRELAVAARKLLHQLGQVNPGKVTADKRVRDIADIMLEKGDWSPRSKYIGSTADIGGNEVFDVKSMSRVMVLDYIKELDVFGLTDYAQFATPFDINTVEGHPMKKLWDDFNNMKRFEAKDGLKIGEAIYATAGQRLHSAWVQKNKVERVAPLHAFAKTPDAKAFVKFQFRDYEKVIKTRNPELLNPVVRCSLDDFPESIRKADPWFFGS